MIFILVLFQLYICDSISTITKWPATYSLRIAVRTQRHLSSRNYALPHYPHFIFCQRTNHRMKKPSVVKNDKVPFFPVMCINQLRRYSGSLKPIQDMTNSFQVINNFPISKMQSSCNRCVDLQGKSTSHRVSPAHGQDLDRGLIDKRQFIVIELFAFRDEAESCGMGFG